MPEPISSKHLKTFALERGADMVGIAPIERFDDAPEMYHPKKFLPTVRSVIVVGNRILRGLSYSLRNNVAYLPYTFFGHAWLSNVRVNLSAFEVARWIEERGYRAVPMPWPCHEGRLSYLKHINKSGEQIVNRSGEQMDTGWPGEGFFSFKWAAVAAGMGEIGWNRLLLTPRFGPRNRLDAVVTDAPLEPDPMRTVRLCNPTDCGYRCVKACPAETLRSDTFLTVKLAGSTFRHSTFDEVKCMWVLAGLKKETCGWAPDDDPLPDKPTPEDFQAKKDKVWGANPLYNVYKTLAGTGSTFCSRCLVVCSDYLEERGRVENLFQLGKPDPANGGGKSRNPPKE